ncbi:glycosyltransferase, partial [Patescibacteria group bacterium]|nr:glycosyltransferase [Patescibacteria group bacterium]
KLLTTNYYLLSIFTVNGWTFNESRPKWQISLIKFFSKLTCLFYDKIICVSEYDYQSAIKNKIAPAKKMIAIHNGIKPEEYDFRERTEKEFTVGTIGEAVKNKGHEYLREAEKKFPDIKFNIISNMPDAARYLKNFDIFVLPSLKEGLPYVLLEAGLAEIPMIATNVGGIPEIIENEKTGLLINPANPDEIADAIKKLIEDKKFTQNIAQNAKQKILKEFSFEKMLDRTLAAYDEKASAGNNANS